MAGRQATGQRELRAGDLAPGGHSGWLCRERRGELSAARDSSCGRSGREPRPIGGGPLLGAGLPPGPESLPADALPLPHLKGNSPPRQAVLDQGGIHSVRWLGELAREGRPGAGVGLGLSGRKER